MLFKVGDKVEWTSQANARYKTKQGVIVAVVNKEIHPRALVIPQEVPKCTGYTSPRGHTSYLVRVGKRTRLYWPRVLHLKKVGGFEDMRIVPNSESKAGYVPAPELGGSFDIIVRCEHDPESWARIGSVQGERNARDIADMLGARFQKKGAM